MNLRDLVGRMAIRTDKVREVMPWEMERAFRLDFMVPVPIFDREKYMDEPVRILAVEGTQVVIEEDGKRKLLESAAIPVESAEVIKKALKKAVKDGTITSKNKWQMIEYWAADYLAGK